VQEIRLKLLFRNLPGVIIVKFEKLTNGSGVTLLSSISHTGQLQGVNGFVVPGGLKRFCFCHDTSPLLRLMNYCKERYYIESGRAIDKMRMCEMVWSGIQSTGSGHWHKKLLRSGLLEHVIQAERKQ